VRELPEGWAEAIVVDLLLSISNGIPNKQNKEAKGIPVTRIETIATGKIDFSRVGFVENTDSYVIERFRLKEGDILFSHINSLAHIGKTALFVEESKELFHGTNLLLLRPDTSITIPSFLEYGFQFLRNLHFFRLNAQNAVNQASLNQKQLKSIGIPLPPLNEQKRIADRLDQLLTRIDKTKAHLDRIPPLLKRFRQSVLAIATSGKLTADWREESLSLGNGEQLLQSIREDRYEMWKHDLIQKGKDWKKIKYKMIQHADIDKIYSIPKSWAWTSLGELTWSVKDGPHYTPQYSESGIPFISGGNITPDGIDFENTRFISPELHQELSERCCPQLGDILYTKGGTTGIARVNTYEIDFNVWVHVSVLKCLGSIESFGVA